MAEAGPRGGLPARPISWRVLVLAVGMAATAVGLVAFSILDTERALPPESAPPPAAEPAPSSGVAAAAPAASGPLAVGSGQTLTLSATSLPAARPLAVELRLPEPSADADPRPVRVYAPDGRQLEIQAPLADSERRGVRVEIPAAWLAPGRYVVEVETTERSHFPLRRYVLQVE